MRSAGIFLCALQWTPSIPHQYITQQCPAAQPPILCMHAHLQLMSLRAVEEHRGCLGWACMQKGSKDMSGFTAATDPRFIKETWLFMVLPYVLIVYYFCELIVVPNTLKKQVEPQLRQPSENTLTNLQSPPQF